MIQIEITNRCNFKCYFCGSRNVKNHNTINNYTFERIIDDVVKLKISKIYLTPSDGDIFMDSNIMNKIQYIVDNNIKIEFVTNFTAISKAQILKISTLKNIVIIVSDYGDGNEELFIYMTRTNKKTFAKYKNNLAYAKSCGLSLVMSSRNLNYNFSYDNTNDLTIEEKYRTVKELSVKKNGVCSMLYSPRIMANGDFIQCRCSGESADLNNDLYIGNIYKTDLIDLYYDSSRYNIFKNQQKNIYNDFCQKCDSFTNNEAPTLNILKSYITMKQNAKKMLKK